jgi:hypothetical protein
MCKRWSTLFLILVLVAPGSQVWAKPTPKPAKKLTPREQAALEEGLFKFLAGLLQIGAGASAGNLELIETGPRDRARQRAAARREGIPLTPQEFQRPSPPPEQDAAPIYEQLTRLLKEKPLDEKLELSAERLGSRYQYGTEDVAAARKLLADRQDVMALVHQATDRPQCVFQRDWLRAPSLLFPEFAPMRAAARLLKVESYLLALDGRCAEAVANQTRGFHLAAHAAADGTLIANLAALACEAITLQGMEDILYLAGPNAAAAEMVRAAVDANRPEYSLRRVLEGEMMFQAADMKLIRHYGPRTLFTMSGESQAKAREMVKPLEQSRMGRRLWKLLTDASEADMLRRMRRALAIVQRPYPERKRLAQQWDDSIADRSTGVAGIFGAMLLPALSQSGPKVLTIQSLEKVVMASAEALAYRAKHGDWPDRLEQFLLYPPIDPFTGRPLKYHRIPDGFVVYSLGESGRDDGGQVPSPGTSARDWKSVFRYPAPPPRPYPPPETPPPVPNPLRPAKS